MSLISLSSSISSCLTNKRIWSNIYEKMCWNHPWIIKYISSQEVTWWIWWCCINAAWLFFFSEWAIWLLRKITSTRSHFTEFSFLFHISSLISGSIISSTFCNVIKIPISERIFCKTLLKLSNYNDKCLFFPGNWNAFVCFFSSQFGKHEVFYYQIK